MLVARAPEAAAELLFNDNEVKQALEWVLFEKKWFEAEADKEKALSWIKYFSNGTRAALRVIRQSQLLSPNTAWLRKLWGEREHDTGCGHDAAETIIDAADDEEGWPSPSQTDVSFGSAGASPKRAKCLCPLEHKRSKACALHGLTGETVRWWTCAWTSSCACSPQSWKSQERNRQTMTRPSEMSCRREMCPLSRRSLPRKIPQRSGARFTRTPMSA